MAGARVAHCEVGCYGSAEGVSDQGKFRPGQGGGLEAQEDLGGVEGRVIAVGCGGRAGAISASEKIYAGGSEFGSVPSGRNSMGRGTIQACVCLENV